MSDNLDSSDPAESNLWVGPLESNWLVHIRLSTPLVDGNRTIKKRGMCSVSDIGDKRVTIIAFGNLDSDDDGRLTGQFLHDWIVVTGPDQQVLFSGSCKQKPTLGSDEGEEVLNISEVLDTEILRSILALSDDHDAFEIFDMLENLMWQVDPLYALELIDQAVLPCAYAIGDDMVTIEDTPRYYVHKWMGELTPPVSPYAGEWRPAREHEDMEECGKEKWLMDGENEWYRSEVEPVLENANFDHCFEGSEVGIAIRYRK